VSWNVPSSIEHLFVLNLLRTFSSDSSGQLNVLWHNGHSLCVDSAQVGILEQANQIGLASLLQSSNSSALEPEISLEILGNLSYETLEGQFPDQQLS